MNIALALILHPTKPHVLIARRRKGAHLAEFWEFPGGKIEPGETAAQCAIREAKEEAGLDVLPRGEILAAITYDYSDRSVTLFPVLCRTQSDDAKPLESDEVQWVGADALSGYSFPPANAPIINSLREILATIS